MGEAITFYEPMAWFRHKETGQDMTLIKLQIITGLRHQIRFHCNEIGHVLIGDTRYDAKCENDRKWCPRVFLHSYCSAFREPFTKRWYEATSPLPQDLGKILSQQLTLTRIKDPWIGDKLLSRLHHEPLLEFMVQYDQKIKPLLYTADHESHSAKAQEVLAKGGAADMSRITGQYGSPAKKRRIIVPPQYANKIPQTPPRAAPPAVKPVVQVAHQAAPVPTLPPVQAQPAGGSHGWTRRESRSQPGVFYYWHEATGATAVDPPAPWTKRESSRQPGIFYWWNPETGATSVELPPV